MIFQNPRSALNLKMPVINMLYESAKIGNPTFNKEQIKNVVYEKIIKTGLLRNQISFDDFVFHEW